MGLEIKIPKFKFPKMKMKGISEIDEVKLDYEVLKKAEENQEKAEKIKHYEPTTYKTMKEIFKRSKEKYADNVFILEKYFDFSNILNLKIVFIIIL